MGATDRVEFVDGSWDPVGGCGICSVGCKVCYAAELAATRHQSAGAERRVDPLYAGVADKLKNGNSAYNNHLTVLPDKHPGWRWPLDWKGPADRPPRLGVGKPSLILTCMMCDLFHEDRPILIIDRVIGTLADSDHIGLLLNRRVEGLVDYFTSARWSPTTIEYWKTKFWPGFSAERQEEFDQRWPRMRELARAGWLVVADLGPMMGPIVLPDDFLALGGNAWVIVTGTQGRHSDEYWLDPRWARSLRDQCLSAKLPFLMKQMSGKRPIPDDLNIRQFPTWPRPRAMIERRRLTIVPASYEASQSRRHRSTVTRVINIRGTHGAGKSTVVRELMRASKTCSPIYGALGRKRPEAYRLTMEGCPADIFLLGPYHTPCGGCDALQSFDLILTLIEKYAARGHVVFEGAPVSSCWGVIGEALERYEKEAVVLFLDTPLETCLQRIEARSGKPRVARLIKNVSGKYRSIERIEARVRDEGIIRAERVSDAAAAARIVRLLSEK
jgi:protein gp37